MRIEREPVLLRQRIDARGPVAPPQQSAGLAEHQVFDDCHVAHQAEVLVDHRDAGRKRLSGAGRPMRPTVENHLAGVGLVYPEDQVAQRRLAGTVFAQQAVDLGGCDVYRDVGQRLQAAEALAEPAQRQQRGRRCEGRRGLGMHGSQPSSTLILPSRMSFWIFSSFFIISGEPPQIEIPEAFGPIARPKAL